MVFAVVLKARQIHMSTYSRLSNGNSSASKEMSNRLGHRQQLSKTHLLTRRVEGTGAGAFCEQCECVRDRSDVIILAAALRASEDNVSHVTSVHKHKSELVVPRDGTRMRPNRSKPLAHCLCLTFGGIVLKRQCTHSTLEASSDSTAEPLMMSTFD